MGIPMLLHSPQFIKETRISALLAFTIELIHSPATLCSVTHFIFASLCHVIVARALVNRS